MFSYFQLITPDAKKLPLYMTNCGERDYQHHIARPDGFDSFQFLWCEKGSGTFIINNESYQITENMCFFISPFIKHEYFPISSQWSLKWIAFDGENADYLLMMAGINPYEVFSLPAQNEIRQIIYKIYSMAINNHNKILLNSSVLLYQLLVSLGCFLNHQEQEQTQLCKNQQRLAPALDYLDQNYAKDLSLQDIASIIHVSPDFLCRLFKQTYSISPIKYLIKLRIQKAKHLLVCSPEMCIKDIAEKVGFHDSSYFCYSFKLEENLTPNQFRQFHKTI